MSISEWFRPILTGGELSNLKSVLDSNFLNDGPLTRAFEEEIARRTGAYHAVAVSNCTSGLYMSLKAHGIGPGHEVIIPDLTFIATAHAAAMTGAEVVLVDCKRNDFTIDPEIVEDAVTTRTRAVVAVDVNGRASDYASLSTICVRHRLALIADLAEALGQGPTVALRIPGVSAGVFSFSPNKTITTGQGGVIVTNHDWIYSRLLELKDQGRPERGTGGDDLHPSIGFNFKFTDLQAAVGLAQLEDLERRIRASSWRASAYGEALSGLTDVEVPENPKGGFTQWQDLLHRDPKRCAAELASVGIGFRRFWHPLHTQPQFRRSSDRFPNASLVSSRGFWVPSSYDVTLTDILGVAKALGA